MVSRKFFGHQGDVSKAVRSLLDPDPIDIHRFPNWIRNRFVDRMKTGAIHRKRMTPSSAGMAIDELLREFGGSWYDHAGRITWDGVQLLASEPYASKLNSQMLGELDAFVNAIGGGYAISPNSQHFPGLTIRIIVAESPEIASDYTMSIWARTSSLSAASQN